MIYALIGLYFFIAAALLGFVTFSDNKRKADLGDVKVALVWPALIAVFCGAMVAVVVSRRRGK